MPIKKSSLERKWYYRLGKVFFLILPLLILIILFLNQKINICNISPENILAILQKNIIFVGIGLISYFLILTGIWKLLLYVIFGGLDDDMKKKDNGTIKPVNQSPSPFPTKPKSLKMKEIFPIIILLGFFAVYGLSELGYIVLPKINLDSSENSKVDPTPKRSCFTTSAQMGTPCRSGQNGVRVTGVITYDYCQCPNDTTYAGMDNITPGGPYKMCTCN